MIRAEVAMFEKRSHKQGWTLLVRLNGTSDIGGKSTTSFKLILPCNSTTTQNLPIGQSIPANYDLTFSYSGVEAYQSQVQRALASGMRIAVVFRERSTVDRMLANGETFNGLTVVDGDDTDIRHLDAHGVAVALYAKGADGRNDQSGFVVH